MVKALGVSAMVVLLGGCGTVDYVPEEYVIAKDRIPAFQVSGAVRVDNIQADQQPTSFFSTNAVDWVGDYRSVTEHLAGQLRKEIAARPLMMAGQGKNKLLQVKVLALRATSEAFHFKATMEVQVKMGNGQEVRVSVSQGSPAGMDRVLNGTLALGVIDILKNDRVRAYLAE